MSLRNKHNTRWDETVLPVTEEEFVSRDVSSAYYDAGGIEVFDIIKAKLTDEQWEGFLLGNVIKYSCRANYKGYFKDDVRKMLMYSIFLEENNADKVGK